VRAQTLLRASFANAIVAIAIALGASTLDQWPQLLQDARRTLPAATTAKHADPPAASLQDSLLGPYLSVHDLVLNAGAGSLSVLSPREASSGLGPERAALR